MRASPGPSGSWVLPAEPVAVAHLRRRAKEFAARAGASEDLIETIALAVSETVTNVVVHAYAERGDAQVRLSCRVEGAQLVVEVADEGIGIAPRPDSPGIGYGLAMVGAMAQRLEVAPGVRGRGTVVTMAFGPSPVADGPPGLEALCTLALETIADASAVHLVRDGVLRRFAAEVAGDAELTEWLRSAMPPAKPGTATWSALREGGAHLVVHDPTVPRTPGGPGERLNLLWWVAVRIGEPDGGATALWGLGGRMGGHTVPTEAVIRLLGEAGRRDLAEPAERAVLRVRLGTPGRPSA